MKKIFSISFLFCIYNFVAAQNFAVSPDKNNIFYLGIDNPITIAAENYPCNSLVIKTDNGIVTGSHCRYTYKGSKGGRADIIVCKKTNGHLKEIERNAFRVKHLPDPVFKIGPSGGGNINKNVLRNQEFVRAELENFGIDVRFAIDSFTICIVKSDTCFYKEIINKGNKISDEVRAALQVIKKGDTIIFKNIYSKWLDSTSMLLAPILLIVTD